MQSIYKSNRKISQRSSSKRVNTTQLGLRDHHLHGEDTPVGKVLDWQKLLCGRMLHGTVFVRFVDSVSQSYESTRDESTWNLMRSPVLWSCSI